MPRQHLVDQGGDLELDALPHWKPVQLAQNWQDEVASVSAHYQLSSSVLGRLEASQQIVGGAAVQRIARVQSTGDECLYHRLRGTLRRTTDDWSQLSRV